MATVPAEREATAVLFGRLATAAAAFDLDATDLAEASMGLGNGLRRLARITTDDTFSTLSVAGPVSADPDTPARRGFRELSMRRGEATIAVTDHRLGEGAIESDLALVRAGGVSPQVVGELSACLVELSPDQRTVGISTRLLPDRWWHVHTRHDHRTDEEAIASTERIQAVAERIGITPLQRGFWANVHRPLCRNGIAVVSVGTSTEAALGELHISYQNLSFEVIVRLLGGIYPDGDHANKLGSFAGAFDVEVASSLILVLRNVEPLRMRFAVEVQG